MSVIESRLREQYRLASESELRFLARQGASAYTDAAWALLQEEIARRRLAQTAVAHGSERAEALAAEPAVAVTPAEEESDEPKASPRAHHVDRLRFTGRGGEYFRIWVVNLLFKVLTLGLYSPWAKVRRAKYFRQNTWLDGHVFDYHGNPAAILRGRFLALALIAAYAWAFQFSNAAGLLTVATLCVAGPWLFMRAQQFSLANTSFRGLRFGFRAGVGEAYATLLPVLVLWLSPAVSAALAIDEGWLFGAPTLAMPWMHHRLKAYQRRNATYGGHRFTFTPAALSFYGVYAKGLGLALVGLVPVGAAVRFFAAWWPEPGSSVATLIYGAVAAAVVYVVVWPYCAARLQQVLWARTRLGGIGFRFEIQARPLFRLVGKNVALTVLSAGLYWPWAAVALARYRVECMCVESDVVLSSLAAGRADRVSATGEGAADAFGLDIGL